MMRRNRLISLLLCVALLCTLLPAAVLAAAPTKLVVGGETFNDLTENRQGEGWSWSADAQVLTLDGYSGSRIFCNGDLTIELPANTSSSISESTEACAIESSGLLTIEGSGTLSVTERCAMDLYGILGRGGVTVSGSVRLDVDARSTGVRTVIGIQATNGDLLVQGSATVTVRATTGVQNAADNASAYGVFTYSNVRVIEYATLNVTTTADGEGGSAEGIHSEDSVFFADNAIANISAIADGEQSSGNGISAWGEVKFDGNASVSTVGTGGQSGYGLIFKTEDPNADEEKISIAVGADVIQVDFQGSNQAVNTGLPQDKPIIANPDGDSHTVEGDSDETSLSISHKTDEYTVTFDPAGGTVSEASAKTGADGLLTSLPTPTRDGNFTFDGWFNAAEGGQRVTMSTIFIADATVYAHWTEKVVGVKQALHLELYLKEGDKYFVTQKPYTFTLPGGVKNVTVYAKADSEVNGLQLHSITGTKPEVVTDAGAIMDGYLPLNLEVDPENPTTVSVWLSVSGSSDFIDTRSNALTFFVNKAAAQLFELSFDSNGGTSIPAKVLEENTEIPLADYVPLHTGYIFTGWYSDKELTTPVTSVLLTGNCTVYAGWKKVLPFTDVKQTNWFYAGVDYCFAHDLMKGMSDTLFAPSGLVTRAQLVTILYRVAGAPKITFSGVFSDVPGGKWYSDAIEWAASKGVVTGYGGGVFKPEGKITREQIATILYRYDGSPAVTGTLSFPDAADVSDYAKAAMLWATQNGLITGIKSGDVTTLSPKNSATRAQIAAIIMRYLEAK